MIPFRTPFFLPLVLPELVWRMPTNDNIIYLTFDDGPIPGPTEFVLATLARYKALGTFFCIGDNVQKHPTVYRQVVDAGHTIGNHTFNHLKGWNYSTHNYLDNIKLCERQINSAGHSTSSRQLLFRPPYGRITRNQIRSLSNTYKIIMWDVLTQDYSLSISPERCLKGSIAATRTGSIIVFHDSLKAERNLAYVLPRYLDHFANKGFVFAPL
jgi:peptidoglycan-N-acetylglucosamine deacetylase